MKKFLFWVAAFLFPFLYLHAYLLYAFLIALVFHLFIPNAGGFVMSVVPYLIYLTVLSFIFWRIIKNKIKLNYAIIFLISIFWFYWQLINFSSGFRVPRQGWLDSQRFLSQQNNNYWYFLGRFTPLYPFQPIGEGLVGNGFKTPKGYFSFGKIYSQNSNTAKNDVYSLLVPLLAIPHAFVFGFVHSILFYVFARKSKCFNTFSVASKGKKGKKKKIFWSVLIFLGILFLVVLHLITTNRNKKEVPSTNVVLDGTINNVISNAIEEFELINNPLVVGKYIPDKSWKLIEIKRLKVYVPYEWITQTWSGNSYVGIGICQSKVDCQDWKILITTEEVSYENVLKEEASQVKHFKDVGIGYQLTRREIVLPNFKGTLLGGRVVVLNLGEKSLTPVIYLDVKNDLHLKILSTLEVN